MNQLKEKTKSKKIRDRRKKESAKIWLEKDQRDT